LEWNTVQEFLAQRKPSVGAGVGGIGNIARPVFGKSNTQTSVKTGLSWLDGVDVGGMRSYVDGPVSVTDVYQQIIPENDNSGSDRASHLTAGSRLSIPDDEEMNNVLGGGIMPGSIILLGGDPGVGKSTLLLQMAGSIASIAERSLQFQGIGMGPPLPSPMTQSESKENKKQAKKKSDIGPVLYISGEENANQIASRALRLGIQDPELLLWCETDADVIADALVNAFYGPHLSFGLDDEDGNANGRSKPPFSKPPSLVIIDSIQTMLCDAAGSSSAGGIMQVRECVGLFLRLAKSTGVPIILVGHVTKSGDVAGPRTVEHMVDSVLYLEAGALLDGGISSLRVLRAAKNRFGSSEEVGVYEMNSGGRLVPVSDPSSYFLSNRMDHADSEGCAVSVVLEGIRSMTVEVQALVALCGGSGSYSGRRVADGISNSRLLLILAVLQKRYGISFHRKDVYLNVVGGMQLSKGSKSGGGADLAVAVAAVSSLVGIPCRTDTCFVGEVGLTGEIRPVHSLDKRISEAKRMGFSRIVTPAIGDKKNRHGPREMSKNGITQIMCDNVLEAINCGLVKALPTKSTMSGPKLKSRSTSTQNNDVTMWNIDDIILDDAEDDIFE
jgi:DNA repair protein RadA/Sms